jgi:hypothetical protein
MFCTQRCHRVSRALFRQMLADGRLEPFLKEAILELQKEAACKTSQAVHEASRSYASWQRGI